MTCCLANFHSVKPPLPPSLSFSVSPSCYYFLFSVMLSVILRPQCCCCFCRLEKGKAITFACDLSVGHEGARAMCRYAHSYSRTNVTVNYRWVQLNNNTSVKTKKAEAHDVGKLVWKCLSWPQSHNKPMISQWLPAFCIAVAFQRLYNYQYWLDRHFLNSSLLSSVLQQPTFS